VLTCRSSIFLAVRGTGFGEGSWDSHEPSERLDGELVKDSSSSACKVSYKSRSSLRLLFLSSCSSWNSSALPPFGFRVAGRGLPPPRPEMPGTADPKGAGANELFEAPDVGRAASLSEDAEIERWARGSGDFAPTSSHDASVTMDRCSGNSRRLFASRRSPETRPIAVAPVMLLSSELSPLLKSWP